MLYVKRLEKEIVATIYKEHLIKDFIPEEQKPLESIINLMQEELYICYGLFHEERFIAYAFFSKAIGEKNILIDYLSVCNKYRNCGYGSKFLHLLKKELTEYDSIIFEVESGRDASNEQERIICQRRLAFYRRNGLKDSNLHVSLYGVDLLIMYLALQKNPSDDTLEVALDAIYDTLFGKEIHRKHVIVSKML